MTTKFPCGHDSLTSEYCANCNAAYHLGQHIRYTLQTDNDRLLRAVAGLSDEERGKLRALVVQQPTATPEEVERDERKVKALLTSWHGQERDDGEAALSRLAAQAARVPGLEEERDLFAKTSATKEEMFNAVVSERDEARGAMRLAANERDAWVRDIVEPVRKALGLDSTTTIVATVAALRERVATLEDTIRSGEAVCGAAGERVAELEARVKALEAQVLATEREKRAVEEHAAKLSARLEDADEALAAADDQHRRAAQPPPAPAQVVCEPCKGRGVQWGTHNECSICKGTGTTSPTAPPGLREAVGPDKSLLRRLANYTRHAPTCNPAGSTSDGACTCGLDDTRNAALAAYDATGGDTVLCPGCKQMAPATEMHTRCTMCAAYEDERTKSATLEASPDAEDAAKYRAAVAAAAPLVPLWRECIERNGRGMLAFPATAAEMAPVIAALATPPTGPGGGVESELVRCVGCSLTEGHFAECPFGRRARIAPAPDDGEPLSPDDAALIDAAWRKHSAIPPAPDAPSLSPAPDSAPASSSPQTDVVWQWGRNGGWKVSPDGGLYCKVWLHGGVDGGWVREVADDQPAIGQVAIQLARALAEAKREVETLKAAAEGDLKTTADMHPADRANASLAWGCAGSLQAALRRERANRMEFARKAAEEMREQAAQWILGVPCLGALTPSFVADNLRALPLLGKAVRRG